MFYETKPAALDDLPLNLRAAYLFKDMVLAAGGSMEDVRAGWAEVRDAKIAIKAVVDGSPLIQSD